jgi:hypothetical protein
LSFLTLFRISWSKCGTVANPADDCLEPSPIVDANRDEASNSQTVGFALDAAAMRRDISQTGLVAVAYRKLQDA